MRYALTWTRRFRQIFERGSALSQTRELFEEPGVEVLAEAVGSAPSYVFSGDEIYVRAKVISTRLKENPNREGEYQAAWVQPVVLQR